MKHKAYIHGPSKDWPGVVRIDTLSGPGAIGPFKSECSEKHAISIATRYAHDPERKWKVLGVDIHVPANLVVQE
jgi:hypothetical protein